MTKTKTKEIKEVIKEKDNNKKSKISKIFNIISYCLLIPIFLMFLSMIGSILITKLTIGVPMVFNYSLLTISSGSMKDAGFDVGDRVFIKKTNPKNYTTGDIIAFYDYVDPFCLNPYQVTNDNKPDKKPKRTRIVFHEIIDVLQDKDGKNWYITKGTNNVNQDRNIIYENYVIGEYQPLSEKAINVLNFIFSIKGALIFVVLPCTIIIFIDCYTLTGLFMELSAEKKKSNDSEDETLKTNSKNKIKKDTTNNSEVKNKSKNSKTKTKNDEDIEVKTTKKPSNSKEKPVVDNKNKETKDKSTKSTQKEIKPSTDKKETDQNNNKKEKSVKEASVQKQISKSETNKTSSNKKPSSKNVVKQEEKKQSPAKSGNSKKKTSNK